MKSAGLRSPRKSALFDFLIFRFSYSFRTAQRALCFSNGNLSPFWRRISSMIRITATVCSPVMRSLCPFPALAQACASRISYSNPLISKGCSISPAPSVDMQHGARGIFELRNVDMPFRAIHRAEDRHARADHRRQLRHRFASSAGHRAERIRTGRRSSPDGCARRQTHSPASCRQPMAYTPISSSVPPASAGSNLQRLLRGGVAILRRHRADFADPPAGGCPRSAGTAEIELRPKRLHHKDVFSSPARRFLRLLRVGG